MNRRFFDRFRQDRTFWVIVAIILVLFVLLSARSPLSMLLTVIALVMAITIHECAHAWVADRLGDPTGRLLGRVSLNPLRHLDPLGSMMMLLTVYTGFGIGWGKPVPVTPYRLRPNPKLGNGLVALSGPASNLLLGSALGLLLRVPSLASSASGLLATVILILAQTNIIIGFFNLIPLPPLDGYSVIIAILSLFNGQWAFRATEFLYRVANYGPLLLFALIFLGQFVGLNILGWLVANPTYALLRAVTGSGY